MNKKHIKYWIIALISVIVIMCLTMPFFIAKSRLAGEIALLRKEGLPTTLREFADKYYKPIPASENAAETFDTAYSLYIEEKDYRRLIVVGTATSPVYDQKIAPVLLSVAQEFIKNNRDLCNKMRELQKYDRIHFEYEWEKGYHIELPRLNKIRNIARIYAVKMELPINQNDSQKAGELLKEMLHINKLASQSPFMIGQLVFYACDTITLGSMERCMNTVSFSPKQLKVFEKICAEHERYVIKRWPYMWKSDLAFILSAANMDRLKLIWFSPYNYPYIKEIPIAYRQAFYYYSGSYISDLAHQIKSSKAVMNVPLDVYVKRKPKLEKIKDDASKKQRYWNCSAANINIYIKAIRMIAYLRCAASACAVERFRLKYGKLPENLGQLVPEFLAKIPVDPFDGKNLRYFHGSFDVSYEVPQAPVKKTENSEKDRLIVVDSGEIKYKSVTLKKTGFQIYSVGRDLSDDSGLSLNKRRLKDVIFTVIDKK